MTVAARCFQCRGTGTITLTEGERFELEKLEMSDALRGAISLTEEIARLRDALDSIRVFGNDTLSGRADGPNDREWQREAVREMARRARAALQEQRS